jgi:uncharacterized protein
MSTIRDVVRAFGERDGVDAVLLLGRDGLPIDSVCPNGVDADSLAALVPSVVSACNQLAEAGQRGRFSASVVECANGYIIVSSLAEDAFLAILVRAGTNVGSLLYELRRYESAIASLL